MRTRRKRREERRRGEGGGVMNSGGLYLLPVSLTRQRWKSSKIVFSHINVRDCMLSLLNALHHLYQRVCPSVRLIMDYALTR